MTIDIEQLKEAIKICENLESDEVGTNSRFKSGQFERKHGITTLSAVTRAAAEYARMQWRDDMENAPRDDRILVETDSDIYAVTWVKNPMAPDKDFHTIRTALERMAGEEVDVESLKLQNAFTTEWHEGWNDCLDDLKSQGIKLVRE